MSELRARRVADQRSGEPSFLWSAFVLLVPVTIVGVGVYLVLVSR